MSITTSYIYNIIYLTKETDSTSEVVNTIYSIYSTSTSDRILRNALDSTSSSNIKNRNPSITNLVSIPSSRRLNINLTAIVNNSNNILGNKNNAILYKLLIEISINIILNNLSLYLFDFFF